MDDLEARPSRAATIRRAIVFTVAAACAGLFVYTRYLVPKGPLGAPCHVDIECEASAPRCLRPDADETGVCSRSCSADADCQEGVRCIEVELDDRDDQGRLKKQGYCFPQTMLDKRRAKRDAGRPAGSSRRPPAPSRPP